VAVTAAARENYRLLLLLLLLLVAPSAPAAWLLLLLLLLHHRCRFLCEELPPESKVNTPPAEIKTSKHLLFQFPEHFEIFCPEPVLANIWLFSTVYIQNGITKKTFSAPVAVAERTG
jgi:hypothetical protein